MKKIKKGIAFAICTVMGIGSALGFASCGGDENIVNDGKTINVRVALGGYGVDWLYQLKDKFEAAYADEGYKVNILTPSSDVQTTVVINELAQGYTGVDLYFPGSVWTMQVTNGDYGMLVEDLSEIVYSQKAIGFDGEEEELTVREKMKPGVANTYNVYYNGKEYGFIYHDSPAGLAVNEKKLQKYGLELPRTTNELLECFDTIYMGTTLDDGTQIGGSKSTGVYPHTYMKGNSGYPAHMYSTWLAQAMGYEDYMNFFAFKDAEGNDMIDDGYTLYEDEAIYETLKVLYQVFDKNYATPGSASQDLDTANLRLADPNVGAVFYSTASWMYNEVKVNYPEYLSNLRMINYPVISSVGIEAFGAGTTANITDTDKCDEVLSEAVRLIDENKTAEEIISAIALMGYTTTKTDVEKVIEARNIYFDRAYGAAGYITKNSPVKDIAALFLRMYASDDNSETFFNTVGSNSVFDFNTDRAHEHQFCKDVIQYANKSTGICIDDTSVVSGIRSQMGVSGIIYGTFYLAPKIVQEGVTKFGESVESNQVYWDAADALFKSNAKTVKEKWSDLTKGVR